jgi:hypothetical protein
VVRGGEEVVARGGGRGGGGELGVEADELGLEDGVATPAEEGVAVEREMGSDGAGAVAGGEEAEGGELSLVQGPR